MLSALAIHHLDDADKRAPLRAHPRGAAPGGVFVNAEQVLGETARIEQAQHDELARAVRANGVPESDLAAALERMTADRLATLDDQLAWLAESGFRDVRCAFRDERFAVYCGTR